jgi:hypothetical protein
MNKPVDDWKIDLSATVACTLNAFSSQIQDRVELFAIDCHPWNGILFLAFLTVPEVEMNPKLKEPAEMAAWRYYDFASVVSAWKPSLKLGGLMREAYEQAEKNCPEVADVFFRACADAAKMTAVQRAISKYKLSNAFRITVCHPDTGQEYYSV